MSSLKLLSDFSVIPAGVQTLKEMKNFAFSVENLQKVQNETPFWKIRKTLAVGEKSESNSKWSDFADKFELFEKS